MDGIFGRSRMVGGFRFTGLARFVFLVFITCVVRQAWVLVRRVEAEALVQ
jgi:hypothetical protein